MIDQSFPLRILEEKLRPIPTKSGAEVIRTVYRINPLLYPQCSGTMKLISFLTDCGFVDRIVGHLKLNFVAERPPPPPLVSQEFLRAAKPTNNCILYSSL